MRQEKNNVFEDIDWLLVFIFIVLVAFGWINIFATTKYDEQIDLINFSTKYGKQLVFIFITIPIIIVILLFNSKFYERFSSIFYLTSIFSLLGLFVFGTEINGAKSWYNFGIVGFQPSEFAKVFTALAVAKILSDRQYSLKLVKNQIKSFIIIFTPALLIALQPDIGSTVIFLSFLLVLNREGLTLNYTIFGVAVIIIFLLTVLYDSFWALLILLSLITISIFYKLYKSGKRFLFFNWHKIIIKYMAASLLVFSINFVYKNIFKQHHKNRIETLLGVKKDSNLVYHTFHSKSTISSGGWIGKGFLKGDITKGQFVPEQHTDYIFCTVGEEWGFFGSSIVIILFMIMLYRIIYLSETQTNKFGRIYGYGVAAIILFHLMLNVGMVTGLMPTIGITLPFFSYGGSSLWAFTVLLFIFIRIDAHKKYDW